MANRVLVCMVSLLVVASGSIVCGQEGIRAPGASLEKLADGFAFTEGPASDAEGNVYFTDQPNDRILKWSIEGELSTFMAPCGM